MPVITALSSQKRKPAPKTFSSPSRKRRSRMALSTSLLVALVSMGTALRGGAQSITPQMRITSPIDQTSVMRLPGNRHPLARLEFDQGGVNPSMPMRVTMNFKMTAAQQAELDALLTAQQQRGSPDYHRWLTPEQFGSRFGLGQGDIGKVTAWLENAGFSVEGVPASRNMITFSGTAQQVEAALHTEIHRYNVRGEAHYSNASDPSIPATMGDVVLGFRGLDNFRLKPHVTRRTVLNPKFTSGVTGNHFITPGDLATIYDVNRLYQQKIDGTGQKIVVVGQSDVALSDIQNFRKAAGLPANDPTPINANNSSFVGLVVPGDTDPGMQSLDIDEANLDVEWAGAMAPKATVIFIVGGVANGQGGVFDALYYAITTSPIPAPVVSISYGGCEQDFGASGVSAFNSLGQQASAEGITILAATGDTGAADCDFNFGSPSPTTVSTLGLAVDLPAALPTVTSMGGTKFNEGSGTYWAPALGTDVVSSALSYIPETAWNETNTTISGASTGLAAGGGGSSAFISKPVWQAGTGVPNDGARDVPDISLSASILNDAYLICSENFDSTTNTFSPTCPNPPSFRNTDGSLAAFGGTSFGPPTMAGIVALINQETNHSGGSGNINPTLYALAAQVPAAFHDVTTGNNQVPFSAQCAATTQIGYNAGTGYDLATGLGSIDAFVMVTNWTSVTAASTGNAASVDFSLAFSPTQLMVKKGSCGTAQLLLTPLHGFSGTSSFTCTVSSTLSTTTSTTTCSVVPVALVSSLLVPGKFSGPDRRGPTGVVLILLLISVAMIAVASRFPFVRPVWRWTEFAPAGSLLLLCVACLSCGGGSPTNNNVVPAVAPSVTSQPMSQTVVEGQPATFSVSANGTAPLSYQWMKNGTPISGATSSNYTTPATTSSDQGDQFSVAVSNSAGNAVSNAATLSLNVPYNFMVQVPSTTATGSGTLTVTAQIGAISHTAQMTLNVN
jgi:subtilase family serine protease